MPINEEKEKYDLKNTQKDKDSSKSITTNIIIK